MKLPRLSLPDFQTWRARWRNQSFAIRELLLFLVCLLAGVFLMPWVIWMAGRVTLGAYANGGPMKLWVDFLRGLGRGDLPFWSVLCGPYLATLFLRVAAVIWRRTVVM